MTKSKDKKRELEPGDIDFALLCKELRKKLGFTQEEMSELLNAGKRSYGYWESGEREPSAQAAFKLCKIQQAFEENKQFSIVKSFVGEKTKYYILIGSSRESFDSTEKLYQHYLSRGFSDIIRGHSTKSILNNDLESKEPSDSPNDTELILTK